MRANIQGSALFALLGMVLALSLIPIEGTCGSQEDEYNGTAAAEQKQRTKLAEGEYVIAEHANGGAVGPFGEEIYNLHETWTLWRSGNNRYEVDGERRFESPEGTARSNRFLVELSRDLTIMRVTEFAQLKWRHDSGPLTCDFLPNELKCSSNAKDAAQMIALRIPMQRPFGLLWPISAFSLSGLTRETERDPSQVAHIQLISIEQTSREIPVNPMVLDGELRYLGEATIDVGGQLLRAVKFSIKAALSPELVVWTTPKGLLLAVSVEHGEKDWPEESMKLLHFQQSAGF